MNRTSERRQNDSAQSYVDLANTSPALDMAAQLTAAALGFPISMINIIDRDSQYLLAQHGFPSGAGSVVPRVHTICAQTVEAARIVVVDDACTAGSSALAGELVVRETMLDAGLRAYAGIPILGREGMAIGTLCVFDTDPHPVTDDLRHLLTLLAGTVEELLDAHRGHAHPPLDPAGAAGFAAAISDGQISPRYQPIVDLDSGRVVAVEVLARWNHPSRGPLTPDLFLDHIEGSELIIDLDLEILTLGLSDLLTWLPADDALRLHVNLSGMHFAHPDCVDRLIALVLDAGCTPRSVVLEITESVSFAANPANTRFVSELRDAGFGVVLDDLGAGWSGLERLLEFALSGFKVDKPVTERIGTRAGDAMMRSLHSLAADLELDFTVEGVETAEQAQLLTALGPVRGQGYWWSEPVPAAQITDLLHPDTMTTGHS